MNRPALPLEHAVSKRPGFTVLEMLAATAIGAIVILTARVTVEQLSLAARTISAAHRSADASTGRTLWLTGLLRRAEGAANDTTSFRGSATSVEFYTTCDAPGGWREPCRGRLDINRDEGRYTLSAWTSLGGRAVLIEGETALVIRYLAPSDTGMSWVREWGHSVLPPAAIAVIGADTAIYRIGRGR